MQIIADMHTHSIVSGHAYSTLQENLVVAADRALPDSIYGVRLLKGVEANILNIDGELDLSSAGRSGGKHPSGAGGERQTPKEGREVSGR